MHAMNIGSVGDKSVLCRKTLEIFTVYIFLLVGLMIINHFQSSYQLFTENLSIIVKKEE